MPSSDELPILPSGDAGDDEGPSLRDIARVLATPALSGIVLPKERIAQLGAGLGLPVGFAERRQMLVNLFRAAADLEQLPQLLAALQTEADRWDARYQAWASEYPASGPVWDEWRRRNADLRSQLAEMAEAI